MNTLQELEDIYDNEIRKDQTKTLQERYWIIVELQTKLKEIFEYYYEYELFRIVLQNYYNGLQKLMKSKSSRFKQFKTSSSLSSTNKESIVYNTPSSYQKPISASYRNRSLRFGEPSAGPSLLKQINKDTLLHSLDQELYFTSNANAKREYKVNCDFDFFLLNNVLYDIEEIPFIGSIYMGIIFYNYLYTQHKELNIKNNPCEFFEDFSDQAYLRVRVDEITKETQLINFCPQLDDKICDYLNTTFYAFVMFTTHYTGHSLAAILYKKT